MTTKEIESALREAREAFWRCVRMENEICADSWNYRLQELSEMEVTNEPR